MRSLLLLLILLSGASHSAEGNGDAAPTDLIRLELLVVNLLNGRHLQFTPQLKLKRAADGALVNAYLPVLRFEFIKAMMGKDPAEVQSTKFIMEFSDFSGTFIDKMLHDKVIKEVLFDSWLIQ